MKSNKILPQILYEKLTMPQQVFLEAPKLLTVNKENKTLIKIINESIMKNINS